MQESSSLQRAFRLAFCSCKPSVVIVLVSCQYSWSLLQSDQSKAMLNTFDFSAPLLGLSSYFR